MTARVTREHGTERGYRQHLYDKTVPCDPCKAAHAAYTGVHRDKDARNAAKRRKRTMARKGSHHVGYCLDSGIVVYANRSDVSLDPVIRAMRRTHDRHARQQLALPADSELVEAWAAQNPGQVCRLPFDACTHP